MSEREESKDYCPMMRRAGSEGLCLREACAWWMYTSLSCAVQVLALYALDRITVISDKDNRCRCGE